jgi:hypothetical protein
VSPRHRSRSRRRSQRPRPLRAGGRSRVSRRCWWDSRSWASRHGGCCTAARSVSRRRTYVR